MDRVRRIRQRGPEDVAAYVIARRSEILPRLRSATDLLLPAEWALVERELRAIEARKGERADTATGILQKDEGSRIEDDRGLRDVISSILCSSDRAGAAARSRFPMSILVKAGLPRDDARAAFAIRKTALKLTAAAMRLGVRRGTLERWCREGVISPSFTRRSPLPGAGAVDIRHFLPEDLDALDLSALEIRSLAVKGDAVRTVS